MHIDIDSLVYGGGESLHLHWSLRLMWHGRNDASKSHKH